MARLALASGGVAVLAHPYSMGLEGADLARVVGELAEAGFGGIEAVYGRYSPRQRSELGNLARRFDLVATGGSDHHGITKPDLAVGTGQGRPEGARPGAGPAGGPPAGGLSRHRSTGRGSDRPRCVQLVTGARSSSRAGSRPRHAAVASSTSDVDQARPPPPGHRRSWPSTRKPTPASAAREISSVRPVVHTTTRDGASVNSSWWSATPATCSPTPERTAISARATPRPPPDTSWMPGDQRPSPPGRHPRPTRSVDELHQSPVAGQVQGGRRAVAVAPELDGPARPGQRRRLAPGRRGPHAGIQQDQGAPRPPGSPRAAGRPGGR